MKYITIKSNFFRHLKTKKLMSRYGARGCVALTKLWGKTADFYPEDGVWRGVDARGIALAAEWDGTPEAFVSALIEIGFLDSTPDGYAIHNWKKHQGLK